MDFSLSFAQNKREILLNSRRRRRINEPTMTFIVLQSIVMLYITLSGVSSFTPLLIWGNYRPSMLYKLQHIRNTLSYDTDRRSNWIFNRPHRKVLLHTYVTTSNNKETENETLDDDASLLQLVSLEKLMQLCDQCNITYNDIETNDCDDIHVTKIELLQRLRIHANTQAELERQRHISRKIKVENGYLDESNSKERYEIVNDNHLNNNDDDEIDNIFDDGYFYFDLPSISDDLRKAQIQSNMNVTATNVKESKRTILTSDQVTAPPPPIEPNANGERVVKIYSTTELNDLTSIASSQPGQNSIGTTSLDTLRSRNGNSDSPSQAQPWDTESLTTTATSKRQIDHAKEQLMDLVTTLLAMSGAPAFVTALQGDDDDDDGDVVGDVYAPYNMNQMKSQRSKNNFLGFNPAKVPVELLTTASKAIRAGRGEVLQEVLYHFEMQGIGYDGMAGDNISKGGGHYREVTKIRAFLEGYRRAEVRRLARETTSMLLDKLVLEGIDSLDTTLGTMIRSNDDTDDYGGTLNDSLLDFLNDVIRQKEKEVEERYGDRRRLEAKATWTDNLLLDNDINDDLEKFWNVTEIDGQRIETIDPNNEEVKRILQTELDKSMDGTKTTMILPETAPEQVLLLLKLLRERIMVEATFSFDEKGRNLRLLAYCLQVTTDTEREQLILKQLGNSLDRLDSFIELVNSSIEYCESTSFELQPSTSVTQNTLNVYQLRRILQLSIELHKRQSIKASGILRP